jgi:hypothetical protein
VTLSLLEAEGFKRIGGSAILTQCPCTSCAATGPEEGHEGFPPDRDPAGPPHREMLNRLTDLPQPAVRA